MTDRITERLTGRTHDDRTTEQGTGDTTDRAHHATDGHGTDGHYTDGHGTDGQYTNGQNGNGQYANGQNGGGQYAAGQNGGQYGDGRYGNGASDTAVTPVRPLSDPGIPPGADNHDLRNENDRSAGQGIKDGKIFQDGHDSTDGLGARSGQGTPGATGAADNGAHSVGTDDLGARGAGTPTTDSSATGATGATGTAVGGPFGGVTGAHDGPHGHSDAAQGDPSYGDASHTTGTHTTGTHGTATHGDSTHGSGTHASGTHGGEKAHSGLTHGGGAHGGKRHTDDGPGETLHRLFPHEDTDKLTTRLHQVVGGFVDAPRGSVAEAEKVLDEVAERLTSCLAARRRTLRTAWHSLGDETADPAADTEQLRLILRDYRELTERLLRL
ncbi:hypothetical protein [Streptomyces fragilis]|uniref:Uncharacterized protein n=2 Tax=Streptomyces fragilis TaxID=67301 RepID=A0ABV2YAX8_9ACTN|nr:hypothetical protein [Streptomyces fragilis]